MSESRFSPTEILKGAGLFAGTTAVVYVIGGMVMWLRFRKAGLPPDHAVALMERQQLLVIGLRLMVLPAVLTGALAWWLMHRRGARARALPGAALRTRAVLKVALVVLAVLFALMLPFSFASATWVVAALAVVVYLRYELRPTGEKAAAPSPARPPARPAPAEESPLRQVVRRLAAAASAVRSRVTRLGGYLPIRRRTARQASPLVVTMLVVVVAALVSLGRQLDQPVQLLSASVSFTGEEQPIEGQYISADANQVFLGIDGRVRAIPRSTIRDVSIGPPQERAPSSSIVSRVFGGVFDDDRFAITPFEWWCNGQRYGWGEMGKLCQTQLDLEGHPSQDLVKNHIPVNVKCPSDAGEPCRGFMTLSTEGRYQVGKSLPRPVSFDAPVVPFGRQTEAAVSPGTSALVCVPVDPGQRGLLRNVRPVGATAIDKTIPFDLTISADRAGRSVLRRTTYFVNIKPEAQQSQSECSNLAKPAAATPSASCQATPASERSRRPLITCQVDAATHLDGLLTVAVTRRETVYAQGASVVNGRRLTVQAAADRAMAPGIYRASVVLSSNARSARTLRTLIRLR